MRKLTSLFFAFAMLLSVVFVSNAISENNPFSAQAQTRRGKVASLLAVCVGSHDGSIAVAPFRSSAASQWRPSRYMPANGAVRPPAVIVQAGEVPVGT